VKKAVLCCIAANLLAGTTFVVMKRAPGGLPDVTFNAVRTLLSTLLFFLAAARTGGVRPRFSARDWLLLFTVAIPGFAAPLLLGLRGVALSTPGNASILALMEPIAIVPLSLIFLREHTPPARLLGLLIGLLGAALVVTAEEGAGGLLEGAHATGNLLLALQGFLWAVYTVAAKPLADRHPPLALSAWITLIGCAAFTLLAPLEWRGCRPPALDGFARALALGDGPAGGASFSVALVRSLPAAAFLGIIGSFLSLLLWNAGLKGVDASRMAIFIFLQPAVGLLLDLAVFGEVPALRAWVGLACIGAAVLLATRAAAARPPAVAPVS
jgi:drug/metabolite transporter (DMT)-like permease